MIISSSFSTTFSHLPMHVPTEQVAEVLFAEHTLLNNLFCAYASLGALDGT